MKLAAETEMNKQFVCQIVGGRFERRHGPLLITIDGTFLFSVPGSVYWIAKRYKIPVLTVVLNNQGWNAPKNSLLLVHPNGEGSKVSNSRLNISFEPTPDYAALAPAFGAHGACVTEPGKLEQAIRDGIAAVRNGKLALLDVRLRP